MPGTPEAEGHNTANITYIIYMYMYIHEHVHVHVTIIILNVKYIHVRVTGESFFKLAEI